MKCSFCNQDDFIYSCSDKQPNLTQIRGMRIKKRLKLTINCLLVGYFIKNVGLCLSQRWQKSSYSFTHRKQLSSEEASNASASTRSSNSFIINQFRLAVSTNIAAKELYVFNCDHNRL